MKKYKKYNLLFGWIVFLISAVVYFLTIEPTASFWDCGEYISTAYKLEVGHPPGAPLFQLIGRFFSLFTTDVTNVAFLINSVSALSSAFTIMFLFWTITLLGKKIFSIEKNLITILGCGLIGSLTYTFTDSFWFSAVESEVYAMSSLFTAVTFWCILKWEEEFDKPHSWRWIILISYLIGLSIGVHLLNLLAIPALILVYYFKTQAVNTKNTIITLILSLAVLGGIQSILIPGIVSLAGKFELFFVNTFSLPFNSGTIIYFVFLISLIIYGLKWSRNNNKPLYNNLILCFTVLLIGYSTFFTLVIRSNADTPIDENNPEDAVSLLSYLNRDQYGSWPILHGQYFNAEVIGFKKGNPTYLKDEKKKKYVVSDKNEFAEYEYKKEFTTIFPRMWSSQRQAHAKEYKRWGKIKSKNLGRGQQVPSFSENLRYFFSYQLGHMYFRYFMWNFSGRQNDIQGHGEKHLGNWISGLSFIDDARLGDQKLMPDYLKNNKGKNTYFFLPLILGIIGAMLHYKKSKNDFMVTMLLFILTGIAIVVYLNQYPLQPRERDYAYVGSFYVFCIWIGLGVAGIKEIIDKYIVNLKYSNLISTLLCLLFVPILMATENWDDHNRSKRYTAKEVASNYLNSCAPNAILFTNGDNDTFPLWYAQEVEGIRTDVRVVNLSLFNTDWYIDQMKRAAYESAPIPGKMEKNKYIQGTRDYLPISKRNKNKHIELVRVVDEFIALDDADTKIKTSAGMRNYMPTDKLKITISPENKDYLIKNNIVQNIDDIVDEVKWKIKGQGIAKNQMMVLDILAHNNWERPIYFAITVGRENFMGLEEYFQLEGLAYRFIPIKNTKINPNGIDVGVVNSDIMYDNMMNKFLWNSISDSSIYIDETNSRMAMNFRNNFSRLANKLIEENKIDSAKKVLDRCMEVMPSNNFPYMYFSIPVAESYMKIKDCEECCKSALTILTEIEENYEQEFNWFANQKQSQSAQQSQYISSVATQMIDQIELICNSDSTNIDESLMNKNK